MHIDPSIEVLRAVDSSAFSEVLNVRFKGYKRYFHSLDDCKDELDHQPQTTLLLARHKVSGVLGTLRLIDRRKGAIELDQFIDVSGLLSGRSHSCAEATRFSVPAGPHAKAVKLLLWKTFMRFCKSSGIERMIVSTREAASRDYRYLLFHSLGDPGKYAHPLLGGREHETFVSEISDIAERFRSAGHPLHDFMFVQHHSQILL